MTRHVTLSEVVMSVDDRIRAIETEELPANVPAILEAAALDAPDSCALNFFEEGVTFSYAELLDAVLATARGFARLGVRRGDKVGVMLNNAPSFPVAWLAIARLGAVMVPINVAYTSRELEFVLANSDASWLCVASDRFPTVEQLSDELKAKLGGHIIVAGEPRDGTLDLAAVRKAGATPPSRFPRWRISAATICSTFSTRRARRACRRMHAHASLLGHQRQGERVP